MASEDDGKETDITVFGATSFVAKHVLRYLAEASKYDELSVTLGGRNQTKLETVKSTLIAENPTAADIGLDICIASGSDLGALKALAKRTRVVINCAGPFALYSSLVVAACAEVGTDYVDITGEVAWVAEMRQKYGPLAKKSGARIISLCGYDSIPSDIALLTAVESLKQRIEADCLGDQRAEVEMGQVWHQMYGVANGGTIHSAMEIPIDLKSAFFSKFDGSGFRLRPMPFFLEDPLILAHPKVRHDPNNEPVKRRFSWGEWINQLLCVDVNFSWGVSMAMPMAPINMKVMQASAVTLGYGENFKVRERYLPLGFGWTQIVGFLGFFVCLFLQATLILVIVIAKTPKLGTWLIEKYAPPGTGFPDHLCKMGTNAVYAIATNGYNKESGTVDRGYAYISFQGDAGNMVTAQCVSEAALTLLIDRERLPERSHDGFGTPAELLGMALLNRFRKCRVRPVEVQTYSRTKTAKSEVKVYIN